MNSSGLERALGETGLIVLKVPLCASLNLVSAFPYGAIVWCPTTMRSECMIEEDCNELV